MENRDKRKLIVFAVLDTNVLVSALLSDSAPRQIIGMVKDKNVIPLFDARIIDEYKKVLNYPKFKDKINVYEAQDELNLILSSGILVKDVEQTKQEFKDKEDIPFYEVKCSSEEFDPMLITGNLKHYPAERNVIVSPQVFIATYYQMNRWLIKDIDYPEIIGNLIAQNLGLDRYEKLSDEVIQKYLI